MVRTARTSPRPSQQPSGRATSPLRALCLNGETRQRDVAPRNGESSAVTIVGPRRLIVFGQTYAPTEHAMSTPFATTPTIDAATKNASIFEFLRRRQRFVDAHIVADSIEAYVVWGATVDALARIHARRMQRSLGRNRNCFTTGLHELLPHHALDRVSIPLLTHELKAHVAASPAHAVASPALTSAPFTNYIAAAAASRLWRPDEDPPLDEIASLARSKEERRLFASNRYSEVLYDEYRCCAVHGLELGRKTHSAPEMSIATYMNYRYEPGDPRPLAQRFRTRLSLPLRYLSVLLSDAIDAEERQAASARFVIPPYPTLDDDG